MPKLTRKTFVIGDKARHYDEGGNEITGMGEPIMTSMEMEAKIERYRAKLDIIKRAFDQGKTYEEIKAIVFRT